MPQIIMEKSHQHTEPHLNQSSLKQGTIYGNQLLLQYQHSPSPLNPSPNLKNRAELLQILSGHKSTHHIRAAPIDLKDFEVEDLLSLALHG
jgi:hypothetical protein